MTDLSDDDIFKYSLERLEISVAHLSDVRNESRIDSEYYKKEFLVYEEKVVSKPHHHLSEIADFLIGPFGSAFNTENYINEGTYRYIRGKDVKPFTLMNDDNRYIPREDYNRLSKYALKENDIMLSVVGTLGNACVVKANDLPAIFSCKSTVVRTKEIMPNCLLAYLNCNYGRNLLVRKERGANQKGLNLPDIQSLLVPSFSTDFQNLVSNIIERAFVSLYKAKNKYSLAEEVLMQELGLDKWVPPQDQISICSFKDVVKSGRIDSEYYQPKYEQIYALLSAYDANIKTLNDIVQYIFTGEYADEYCSYGEGMCHFIRGTDIDDGEVISADDYCVQREKYSKFAYKGDIVTARVGALGRFGVIDEEINGSLCSDNILCFRLPDNYIPEAYSVYFNLPIIKEFILRESRGSVQQRLNQETLRTIYVPFIAATVQMEIRNCFVKSKQLKKETQRLFEVAKHTVEIAIEKDEKNAVEYLGSLKENSTDDWSTNPRLKSRACGSGSSEPLKQASGVGMVE